MKLLGGLLKASWNTSNAMQGDLHNAIQTARANGDVRSLRRQVKSANTQNRSVGVLNKSVDKRALLLASGDDDDDDIIQYSSRSQNPGLDFIWGDTDDPNGIIASGGQNETRVKALSTFVIKSQNQGTALFALHNNNNDLVRMLKINSRDQEFISPDHLSYDAFRGMPGDDIVFLLYSTMPADDANPRAEALLRALVEVMLRTTGSVTFHEFAAFPLHKIQDTLDELKITGQISNQEYQEISRDSMAGSPEIDLVRIFLNRLCQQSEMVFGNPRPNASNIRKTINQRGVISINVGASQNDLILSFVIHHLLLLQSQRKEFNILLDDIPVSRFPKLIELIRGRTFAIGHRDFIASLYGGEKPGDDLFFEIAGDVSTFVIMNHTSGKSCQSWSEFLGTYLKARVRDNITQNRAFRDQSTSWTVSVDVSEEPRVRAATLGKLPGAIACVHSREGTLFADV